LLVTPLMAEPEISPESVLLGERIRRARLARGMSQTELAKRVGRSQPMVAGYEAGTRSLSATLIPVMARALGTTAAALHGESADPSAGLSDAPNPPNVVVAGVDVSELSAEHQANVQAQVEFLVRLYRGQERSQSRSGHPPRDG
jgi:transcriptional regulator with XRE-family HTH domain